MLKTIIHTPKLMYHLYTCKLGPKQALLPTKLLT